MKIGIIGAGRVGCAFAFSLASVGYEISGIYSQTKTSADFINERIKEIAPGRLCNVKTEIAELLESSDLILLTVPDSEIAGVAEMIAGTCPENVVKRKTIMHCSGASTSKLLSVLEAKGAYIGSLHPAQTFPDRKDSWKTMFNIYFGFEGSSEAEILASEIISKLDGVMLKLEIATKPLYHAAACIISNYTVAVASFAEDIMDLAGINREDGMKIFRPLFESTVNNIVCMGSRQALTGPISRGDTQTIEGHLKAIDEFGQLSSSPEVKNYGIDGESLSDAGNMKEIYKALGRLTTVLAAKKGSIDKEKVIELMGLLKD